MVIPHLLRDHVFSFHRPITPRAGVIVTARVQWSPCFPDRLEAAELSVDETQVRGGRAAELPIVYALQGE